MDKPLLRIVFDTNVYISAALHGRRAGRLLEMASAGHLILLTSEAILAELDDKLRNKLAWTKEQADLFVGTIRDVAEIVTPAIPLKVVLEDEDDNRVLECALSGQAELILTFDHDLLRLKSYRAVGIIEPRQLAYYGI